VCRTTSSSKLMPDEGGNIASQPEAKSIRRCAVEALVLYREPLVTRGPLPVADPEGL